jgi:hypothetical protein
MEDTCLHWNFLEKETIHHVFVSINGVKLLVMVARDVAGNVFTVCHARRRWGALKIDGFYHGGRLYPARLFHLYLQAGFDAIQSKPGRSL